MFGTESMLVARVKTLILLTNKRHLLSSPTKSTPFGDLAGFMVNPRLRQRVTGHQHVRVKPKGQSLNQRFRAISMAKRLTVVTTPTVSSNIKSKIHFKA